MTDTNRLILCLSLALSLLMPGVIDAAELSYTRQTFQLPAESENLIVADTNGDGLGDLITVIDNVIRIYFQNDDGFNFESGFDDLELSGQAVGWTISSAYGDPDSASIIALVDGSEVLVWHITEQTIQAPQVIKSGLDGYLGKGVNRLYFSRDVNGDGSDDLVIPGAGVLRIYISDGNGDYQAGLSVQMDTRMRTNLNSNRLERRTGQEIRIPLMRLRDVNNDGFDDLVSRTAEKLDVFLAAGNSSQYFPATPSYSLDIAEIEERVANFNIEDIDFSNLTGLLSMLHEEILEDVDGDGIEDLLLREGGKVSLYGGTKDGMNFEQPRQVLRSGGNVMTTFLYDEDEDGLKDLWLWRIEPISVGDIFVWLAFSGSIAIEAFIYPNDGERFARRPTRKLTVNLKFPSVIRLASKAFEIVDEIEQGPLADLPITGVANLDNDLDSEDLLVLINNQLEIFLNSIEPENNAEDFLETLNYDRQRNDYEIDIREIINNISINRNPHLDRVADRTADQTILFDTEIVAEGLIPVRLNRDELDDVIVFTERDGSHIQGILLLSD